MIVSFLGFLLLGLLLVSLIWGHFVCDKLYVCTDSGGAGDFLIPLGGWYHPEHGDTLAEGVTERTLWGIWWSLAGIAVAVSGMIPGILYLKMNQIDGQE